MSHYALTEEQQYEIHHARLLCQFVIDLTTAVPRDKQLDIDPEGLSALCTVIQSKLPTHQTLAWHTS